MTLESPNMIPPEALELTRENISRMSPDMAAETLAAMQKKYTAENPVDRSTPEGIRAMSPAEATAALAKLSGRPTDADGRAIPLPPFTGIISSHELEARQAEETKTYLEEHHFPARGTPEGDDLWNMLDGKTAVSPELQKAAETKLKQLMGEKDWVRRLMEGDPLARRQKHLADAIITAGKIQRNEM